MRKVLLISLLMFTADIFADEHELSEGETSKVCHVLYKTDNDKKATEKSYIGLNYCKKGDILFIERTKRGSLPFATLCELDSINQISKWFGVCIYIGFIRDVTPTPGIKW